MSQKSIIDNQPQNNQDNNLPEVFVIQLLEELQLIPTEYQSNLLQIVRSFRESVTSTPELSDPTKQNTHEADQQLQKNLTLNTLTQQWSEEEDEQEQAEAWGYLLQMLD